MSRTSNRRRRTRRTRFLTEDGIVEITLLDPRTFINEDSCPSDISEEDPTFELDEEISSSEDDNETVSNCTYFSQRQPPLSVRKRRQKLVKEFKRKWRQEQLSQSSTTNTSDNEEAKDDDK